MYKNIKRIKPDSIMYNRYYKFKMSSLSIRSRGGEKIKRKVKEHRLSY